ncbi:hypothetical protein FOL46_003223 [Perkinsus olseni]|uniref:Uncharacterized protein n=1 Tax=Perkinsus olseni TaxID=32597 RepID=A0A7J6M3R8_PEROL|nr:hypothetical protein FOL46_003223 [Perkinsus olseni]
MPGRKLIVKGRAAHPSVVQRRQELARAKAEFEAVRSEKTLVKIRWEHKPQKMLWVSSNCFKGHVLSTPERPAFYLGPMPGFFDGDVMQVVRSVSAHPGPHPTLRPNKLLPPPKVRVLPCIDEGHSVQYPLLSSTAESDSITLRNSKEMQAKQDCPSDESLAYTFRQRLRGITADGLEVLAGRMQDRSDLPPVLWRVLGRYIGRRCAELPLATIHYLLTTDMAVYCEDWHLIKFGLEVHLREFARCPDGEFGMAGQLALLKVVSQLPRKVAAGLAAPLGNFLPRAVPLMDSRTLEEVCRLLLPLSRYGVAEGWWNAAAVKMASLGPPEATVSRMESLLQAAQVSRATRKLLGEVLRDSTSLAAQEQASLSPMKDPKPVLLQSMSDAHASTLTVQARVPEGSEALARGESRRAARYDEVVQSSMPKYPVYPLSSTPILWHLSPPHFTREVFNLTAHKLALVVRSAAADGCGLGFRERHRGLPRRLTDRARAEDFAGVLVSAAVSRVDRFSHRDLCIVIQSVGSLYRTRLVSEVDARTVLEPALARLMTNEAVKRTLPIDLARVLSGVKHLPASEWRTGIVAGLERHTVFILNLPYTVPLREAIPPGALVSLCVAWGAMRGSGRALRLLANHLPERKGDLGPAEWVRCVQALSSAKGGWTRRKRRLERRLARYPSRVERSMIDKRRPAVARWMLLGFGLRRVVPPVCRRESLRVVAAAGFCSAKETPSERRRRRRMRASDEDMELMDFQEKLKWAATVVVATVLPLYVMYKSAATTSAKYTEQLALQEAAERREWLRMAAVHEKADQKYSADPAERAKGEAQLARPGETL